MDNGRLARLETRHVIGDRNPIIRGGTSTAGEVTEHRLSAALLEEDSQDNVRPASLTDAIGARGATVSAALPRRRRLSSLLPATAL